METTKCTICLEDHGYFKVLSCNHDFHEHCLHNYLERCKNVYLCPNCRKKFKVPKSDITKFIEKLPIRRMSENIRYLSCKEDIHAESINKMHDGCTLALSAETQKTQLLQTIQKEVMAQEENFEKYCHWIDEKKRANLKSVEKYASDLISQVSEWKKSFCDAIEMYFQKDRENLEKLNTYFIDYTKVRKSSISNLSEDLLFRNRLLPEDGRVDFSGRKEKSRVLDLDVPASKQRDILASLLPATSCISQAIEEFKDPPGILPELVEEIKDKASVDVTPPVCSAIESASEKDPGSAVATGSLSKCISDFYLISGNLYRAKILPNDTIIVCSENPNLLEMYDLVGNLLSSTKLNDIPADMTVWKDNQIIICYQNLHFEIVMYENNNFNAQKVLEAPQHYDSISSLKSGLILGKYDKHKCDILKIENSKIRTIKTFYFHLSEVQRIHGGNQYDILYSGCNNNLMPNQICCYNPQTQKNECVFPVSTSSNLSSENIKDFTVSASLLLVLDFPRHKVYSVDQSRNTSVLLTEKDGIQSPFCVDINESGHLLVCYNSMKQPKIKVFRIE